MTFGLCFLAASLLLIFGVLIGGRINELRRREEIRRQAAVQRSLNELQAATQKDYTLLG